jgi:hypothetical protein
MHLTMLAMQVPQTLLSFARDAAQAAFARGVLHFASAIASFYFCRDPFGNGRAARFGNLVVNVSASEPKAIANGDQIRSFFNTHAH